jgi:hypothetical protein
MSAYSDLLSSEVPTPQPSREDTWGNPAWKAWHDSHDKGRCLWDISSQLFTAHADDCKHAEFDPAYWQELIVVKERAATARAAAAPKAHRVGRITDRESSRREAKEMGQTALNDPRLTRCMRYCYLQMAARWYESGSVYVVATPGWLAARSEDRFTPKQCKRALVKLRLLGYLDPATWSKVKKRDPGLYGYVKQKRAGTRGTWPAVYHMRQDLPEQESVPDDQNPLLEMAAAV